MMFRDGYEALDALDDNRDRRLVGDELAGLAVWFDRDGDGVSCSDEVVSVQALRINAISTQATRRAGREPMCDSGVEFHDGRVLPTYDWVAEPAPRSASEQRGVTTTALR